MTDQNNDPTPPPSGYSQPAGASQPDPYAPQGGYAQPAYGTPAYGTPPPSKTLSLISMILGIVGVLFGFVYGSGILFAIAAVILGHLGKKREGLPAKPFWLTGLITGYIGIALAAIVIIVIILAVVIFAASGASYN